MIVVRLIGGLGNQMFQYVAGRALAIYHNTDLYLDTTYLGFDPDGAYTKRNYELEPFALKAQIADKKVLGEFQNSPLFITKLKSFFPGMFNKMVFNESQTSFHEQFFKLPANTYLNGYWQDENYFSTHRELLLKEFDLRKKSSSYQSLIEQVTSGNSISIHVRHGDYLTLDTANAFHGVLPLTYYLEAVEYFTKTNQDFTFFIFSDDLDWCRKNLGFITNAHFIDGKKLGISSQEELLTMSHCQHNIIANSSFSWWAAWLNTNKNKTVIAPHYWFNKMQEQPENLIPFNWIRLK